MMKASFIKMISVLNFVFSGIAFHKPIKMLSSNRSGSSSSSNSLSSLNGLNSLIGFKNMANLPSTINKTIENIQKRLLEKFSGNLKCLILYGSWAKGTAHGD
jgi:hypothetical protein